MEIFGICLRDPFHRYPRREKNNQSMVEQEHYIEFVIYWPVQTVYAPNSTNISTGFFTYKINVIFPG